MRKEELIGVADNSH